MKASVARPRPFEVLDINPLIAASMASFPSGHAMQLFCILPFIEAYHASHVKTWFMLATLVAISRVYVGVHYLSDVIAGAAIGYAIGWICMHIYERTMREDAP